MILNHDETQRLGRSFALSKKLFPRSVSTMAEVLEPQRRPAALSSRRIVALMFFFGITATAVLFGYWTWHVMPFMPLQKAIVAEFKGSAPRVDGGQRKMRDNTPVILRVVMKTEFDPYSSDTEARAELARIQSRVVDLSREHTTLPDLQFIELHLYKLLKEKEVIERSYRFDVLRSVWEDIDAKGQLLKSAEMTSQNSGEPTQDAAP